MYRIFLFIVIVFCALKGYSKTRVIEGQVIDAENKEPISFCNVILLNSNKVSVTDNEGKFNIEVSVASGSTLAISYIGYKTENIAISDSVSYYKVELIPTQQALNEVVITGVAKTTYVRENPMSIISIPARILERSSESNIIDALTNSVPGLTAVKTGPNISKPYIRGLGYNRVLILYDGIRQEGQQWGDEHGVEVDGYNIGKAEVIKGPASLMYGSDALAGVVSILPSSAKTSDSLVRGNIISEYQTNNGLIGNGFKIGQAGSRWLWFFSGSVRVAKNYKNNIDGLVYNTGFKETNLSGILGYSSKKGYSNLNVTFYDNIQGIPDGSRDSLSRRFTKQIYELPFDNVYTRPIVSNAELNSYAISPLHQHIEHYRIYSNNHYKIGGGDIEALLAFQQNLRKEYNHPTQPKQAGMSVRLNTLNYGIRYNAPDYNNIAFTMGINGMLQNNTNQNATDFPIPNYSLLDMGAYSVFKWKYNKVTLSGGARYDLRLLNGNDFYLAPNLQNGFEHQVSSLNIPGAALKVPAFNFKFKGLSVSLGSTYLINEQIYIKANVARAFRAPSITELVSNGLDPGAHIVYIGNKDFEPEFSLQEDIGISAFYPNFTANVSVFNNNLQHYIYLAQLVDNNGAPVEVVAGNKTFKYQQSTAQLYGFEISLNIHPQFIRGFSFNNSCALAYGKNTKADYNDAGNMGANLPLIPPLKVISSINEDYKLKGTFLKAISAKLEYDYNAAQNRFLALNNTETYTPSYTLFNMSVGFDVNYYKKLALVFQFQVNNVFNTSYQSNLSRLKYFEYYSQSPNGNLGIYNMGRNVCFKVILPF